MFKAIDKDQFYLNYSVINTNYDSSVTAYWQLHYCILQGLVHQWHGCVSLCTSPYLLCASDVALIDKVIGDTLTVSSNFWVSVSASSYSLLASLVVTYISVVWVYPGCIEWNVFISDSWSYNNKIERVSSGDWVVWSIWGMQGCDWQLTKKVRCTGWIERKRAFKLMTDRKSIKKCTCRPHRMLNHSLIAFWGV